MNMIIEIANCIIEIFIFMFFIKQMLEPRKIFPVLHFSIVLAVFSLHTIRSFVVTTTYLNFCVTFILFGSLAVSLYKDTFLKKFIALLIYVFVIISTDLIARSILSFMFQISTSPMQTYQGPTRYIGMSIVNITTFTILALFSAFAKQKSAPVDFKYRIIMVLFPLLSMFITICCDIFLIISGTNNLNHVALLSLILLSLLFFNSMIFEFMKSYSAKLQLDSANMLIAQQEENYNNIQISENELSSLRHDILNHINTMETMLSQSHTEDAKKLLDDLKKSPQLSKNLVYTNDAALDAILNFNAKKASRLNVNYLVKTNNMTHSINMTSLDKSTVLSNALNNAFEACENVNEKFIVIDISSDKDRFRICIENSSLPPRKSNGIFLTTKADDKKHGFGIANMKSTIKKYNGNLSISYQNGITTLTILANN